MWQNSFMGNQFQNSMQAKFNVDISSTSAIMSYVRGKEDLVYKYISDMASLFQPVKYGLGNPTGLYSDYDLFRRHFIKYWRNALDVSRKDSEEFGDIFDEEVSSQASCKNRNVASVFFENGKALTADDCLDAIYEVLKTVATSSNT